MEIVNVKINELVPADYNPRLLSEKEYEELKKSLERFGLVDPVIVNSNPERKNIIIGGHQRMRVWQDLGNETIPVVYLNLTEAQERELNLRLNKNTGHWDYDALANYFDNSMLFDVGFTENELGLNIPTDDFNKSELGDAVDVYLEGTIKQITLFFKGTDNKEPNDYGNILSRLDKIQQATGKENHTDVFLLLLEEYENNRNS